MPQIKRASGESLYGYISVNSHAGGILATVYRLALLALLLCLSATTFAYENVVKGYRGYFFRTNAVFRTVPEMCDYAYNLPKCSVKHSIGWKMPAWMHVTCEQVGQEWWVTEAKIDTCDANKVTGHASIQREYYEPDPDADKPGRWVTQSDSLTGEKEVRRDNVCPANADNAVYDEENDLVTCKCITGYETKDGLTCKPWGEEDEPCKKGNVTSYQGKGHLLPKQCIGNCEYSIKDAEVCVTLPGKPLDCAADYISTGKTCNKEKRPENGPFFVV